jgi:Uma2 family endonuclease
VATVAVDPNGALTKQVEPDGLYEVIDGRFVEKAMSAYENWLAGVFFGVLDRYSEASAVGRAVQELLFDFRPVVDRERRPDVAFVSFERWPRDRRVPQTRSWGVIPDLAVEIISPTNTANDIAEKLREYFRVGVRQVWVVYPSQAWVYVYTSTRSVRVLAPGADLDGGDVLPGLRISVKDSFDKAPAPG